MKIKYIVKNQTTLELQENASKGDIIDLTEEISIDTSSIEKRLNDEINAVKDKVYAEKIAIEKKALVAEKEKEKAESENGFKIRIRELESIIANNKELYEANLKHAEDEKKHSLDNLTIDLESKYSKQISELQGQLDNANKDKILAVEAEAKKNYDELAEKNQKIALLEKEISSSAEKAELDKKIAIENEVKKNQDEIVKRDQEIAKLKEAANYNQKQAEMDKELAISKISKEAQEKIDVKAQEIIKLKADLEIQKQQKENELKTQKESFEIQLKLKEEQLEQYKDFKQSLSTKMIGESLEQHCLKEFNKLRMTAFPNAYFAKDNDSSSGSKGDFIYRENGEDGTEVLSIMFEMKNEMDTTGSKHKNEEFFKELDKDRREKKCEYAVLVSLLEKEDDFYNQGIVDVSYEYPKMYVIRPQFFISLISILRNSAYNAYQYKIEMNRYKSANIDVTNFEKKLNDFKDGFIKNYMSASNNFDEAIKDIDATIKKMENIKSRLLTTQNQLRLANNKVDEVTVKKLTYNNPTMKRLFEEAKSK